MPKASSKTSLYKKGAPKVGFNRSVLNWLKGTEQVREHKSPAAFEGLRTAYDKATDVARIAGKTNREAHRITLSRLTELLFGHDLGAELAERLLSDPINKAGFRTTLSQGVAKNVGENFVNIIVYALADLLSDNDAVLVDKGLPPALKEALVLKRQVKFADRIKTIHIPIEGDLAIFSRTDPTNAIIISAKTRLKEVFHIGTMWALLFDAIEDEYLQNKWGLEPSGSSVENALYVFATADMVNASGHKTQGPDVERDQPRNLIAMDASFFDFVLVSKTGISHVSDTVNLAGPREALFHELGCLIDIVEQKFGSGPTNV